MESPMRLPQSLLPVALLLALALASANAAADDAKPSSSPVPSTAEPAVLPAKVVEFKGVARFHVVASDRTAGTVTIRLAEPAVRLVGAPVVTVGSAEGAQTLTFVPVDGQPGTWRLTSPLLRQGGIDGSTMKIVVGDKTYSAPFLAATAAPVTVAARHGGRIVTFSDCGTTLEVARDPATGTLAIFAADGVRLAEPPTVVLGDAKEASTVRLMAVDGQAGAWTAVSPAFKEDLVRARLRLTLGGHACEADITDGQVVVVDGLRLQVAAAKGADTYLVRALDATLRGN